MLVCFFTTLSPDIREAIAWALQPDVCEHAGPNILLTSCPGEARGFTSKISDFGLSRLCTSAEIETKTSGTVTHAPPELLSDGHLSQAGDVFAFGVLLWEMWHSRHAWSGLLPYQV